MMTITTAVELDSTVKSLNAKFASKGITYEGIFPDFEDSTVPDGTYNIRLSKNAKRTNIRVYLPINDANMAAVIDGAMIQVNLLLA